MMQEIPGGWFERLPHGISAIDTGFGRPGYDAAYLVVDAGRAAFIDTGTNRSVPRLLGALGEHGLNADDVDWVIVTHVHLDHAGGAGLLMHELPQARLAVHPRGARHMIDPTQLLAGVRQVYGEETVRRDYGELVPVSAERVVVTHEGMELQVGRRSLRVADTPGHARHHNCLWDECSRGWFVGDTLGIAYPEMRSALGHYGLPATTPVQFDPMALRGSIERLRASEPEVAYLTHYGLLREVRQQADMVLRQVEAMLRLAERWRGAANPPQQLRQELETLYLAELRRCGITRDEGWCREMLALDVELNAQGLECWLRV